LNTQDILKYQEYFGALAQTLSILTENINMQMESENSDLLDRKLMALYGVQGGKPSKMDQAGKEAKAIGAYKKSGDKLTNTSVDAPT